eukprot:CAMPEP_0170961888 /NCGR_PEP_ID=MMETSP0735-20130129/38380_1 /TAXON_ID=186038 /ORGANISM="Fragilariopsis kerguelensis, Strain L26-C5" /LENGTH=139 /DNA_ID=CAMNT_0011377711 /DNA_START=20 /DNA_END=442 /DNA_ORIENTATION=+
MPSMLNWPSRHPVDPYIRCILKLTCILYLNPSYDKENDGGELQIVLSASSTSTQGEEQEEDNHPRNGKNIVNLTPEGGRLVCFWSDEVPHQVLETAPDVNPNDTKHDRYALTVWIPTENMSAIHSPSSKFRELGDIAFS